VLVLTEQEYHLRKAREGLALSDVSKGTLGYLSCPPQESSSRPLPRGDRSAVGCTGGGSGESRRLQKDGLALLAALAHEKASSSSGLTAWQSLPMGCGHTCFYLRSSVVFRI